MTNFLYHFWAYDFAKTLTEYASPCVQSRFKTNINLCRWKYIPPFLREICKTLPPLAASLLFKIILRHNQILSATCCPMPWNKHLTAHNLIWQGFAKELTMPQFCWQGGVTVSWLRRQKLCNYAIMPVYFLVNWLFG